MKNQVKVFKALSSEPRLDMLRLLKEHTQCVKGIASRLRMTQPAVSQNLRLLKEAGLVKASKKGNWMHYEIDQGALERHGKAMAELFGVWFKPQKAIEGTRNCPQDVLKECQKEKNGDS